MASSPFSDAIRDRLILIERAAYAIEQGAGDADIFDLRLQLIDLLGLIHRNPSIEAASQDLYDTAAAYAAGPGASAVRQPAFVERSPSAPAGAPYRGQDILAKPRAKVCF